MLSVNDYTICEAHFMRSNSVTRWLSGRSVQKLTRHLCRSIYNKICYRQIRHLTVCPYYNEIDRIHFTFSPVIDRLSVSILLLLLLWVNHLFISIVLCGYEWVRARTDETKSKQKTHLFGCEVCECVRVTVCWANFFSWIFSSILELIIPWERMFVAKAN